MTMKMWKMCVVGLMVLSPVICAGTEISDAVEGANDGAYVVIDGGEWVELTFTFSAVPEYPAVKLTLSSPSPDFDITVSYYNLGEDGQPILIDMEGPNPNDYPGSDLATNPYVAAPSTFHSMTIEVTGSTVSLDGVEFVNHFEDQPVVVCGRCSGGTGANGVEVVSPTQVAIDIKPGTFPNPINQGANGVIPVAILTTSEFNAADVDPATVVLNGATVAVRGKSLKLMAHMEDVDGDGDQDLLCQVDTVSWEDLGADGDVILTGKTYAGEAIEGKDSVVIVP